MRNSAFEVTGFNGSVKHMDKLAHPDWKEYPAPFDFTLDSGPYKSSVGEMFDQAMEAFNQKNEQQWTAARGDQGHTDTNRIAGATDGTKISKDQKQSIKDNVEFSTNLYTPGVLKIFGESIVPGVQYKSVLASCRSTAQEIVKQALERFGLSAAEYKHFALCDVVGRAELDADSSSVTVDNEKSSKWERICARVLSDRDKPLLLQTFWKPIDGYCRRYELHELEPHVTSGTGSDDKDHTSGLNEKLRKTFMSKLRPGVIPQFKCSTLEHYSDGLNFNKLDSDSTTESVYGANSSRSEGTCSRISSSESDITYPTKYPFFVNIRGFDVHRDKALYVIKSKRFTFGNPNLINHKPHDDVPKFHLFGPDIESVQCNFKAYRFKKSDAVSDTPDDRNNYLLELEPVVDNMCLNGHKVHGKALVKSGDIISIGKYYVLLFKDCSKGYDIPLVLPWLQVPEMLRQGDSKTDHCEYKLNIPNVDEESNSKSDESVDVSIAERMVFAYTKEKEDELVKYICAIIQQQNTTQTYSLTVALVFSMCIEYASQKFERRQLKNLFLRILFTIRENIAETTKSLSASKFACTLLDSSRPQTDKDQKCERLLLWTSNSVQLLLFLKHTFQLPDTGSSERVSIGGQDDRASRVHDSTKHALGQLVTGLEEIIMFSFQQCVYTITKALHQMLPALLNSNPFSATDSEQHSMEDIIHVFESLAEVTHSVMLHEGITRQLFTYLFFFTNTNIFNKLVIDDSGQQYYNWPDGVRLRANISQLEDWATRNGLEDEFSQMFERLLAVSELLATSKSTLLKYQWQIMKTHYQPLTPRQLYHVLISYQLGDKPVPTIWLPTPQEMEDIQREDFCQIPLSTHPPFALPDNCGTIDLVRAPEDVSFWNHLHRLKSLYGTKEDDSDSGFSPSNSPRSHSHRPIDDLQGKSFFEQNLTEEKTENVSPQQISQKEFVLKAFAQCHKTCIPVKKSNSSPWSVHIPKVGTGVCQCASDPINSDDGIPSTLAADVMKEEQRDSFEGSESTNEQNDIMTASLQSKSTKIKLCSRDKQSNSELNEKQNTNRCNHAVLNKDRRSNVENCSARNLVNSLEIRERSNSICVQRMLQDRNNLIGDSFSPEDLPVRVIRHKPSASFEEAINQGYNCNTRSSHCNNISELKTKSVECIAETDVDYSIPIRSTERRYGLKRRHKSHVTESTSSEEVVVKEQNIDDLYKLYHCNIATKSLPNNLTTFKPFTTSSCNNDIGLNIPIQKIPTGSVGSDSGSSVELAKDDLFRNGADDIVKNHNSTYASTDRYQEVSPWEQFTEINENTLTALKRQGSYLNIATSDSSPRTQVRSYGVLGPEERKQISPCPLVTVTIEKGKGSLGVGLIDGLHTTLRLAGIYIRKILPNSPAAVNECLQVGDRILAVDGNSVIGADYDSTMKAIKEAGDTLTLLVAKGNESIVRKLSSSQL